MALRLIEGDLRIIEILDPFSKTDAVIINPLIQRREFIVSRRRYGQIGFAEHLIRKRR